MTVVTLSVAEREIQRKEDRGRLLLNLKFLSPERIKIARAVRDMYRTSYDSSALQHTQYIEDVHVNYSGNIHLLIYYVCLI